MRISPSAHFIPRQNADPDFDSQLDTGVLSGVLGLPVCLAPDPQCAGEDGRQGTAREWARTNRREWSDRRSRLVGGLLPLPVKVT